MHPCSSGGQGDVEAVVDEQRNVEHLPKAPGEIDDLQGGCSLQAQLDGRRAPIRRRAARVDGIDADQVAVIGDHEEPQ